MAEKISYHFTISNESSGERIDKALSMLLPQYSRSQISQWIKQGDVSLNNQTVEPKHKVTAGDIIELNTQTQQQGSWQPQAMDLTIQYEDDDLLIINKPVGLVVHPGAGNPDSTLVNALLHYHPDLSQLARAGIIHRLDKDTSGLLLVAKKLTSYTALVKLMQQRHIKRYYKAIARGHLNASGSIDAPIGRHPRNRLKMAVVAGGKPALTHYRAVRHYNGFTLLDIELETGRTHQIRVHFAHIKHPLVGDQSYGGKLPLDKSLNSQLKQALQGFNHQALHAYRLVFEHPISKTTIDVTAPLNDDMVALCQLLEQSCQPPT